MLSSLASSALERHPDCPELRELVSVLTEKELELQRAAQRARADADEALCRLTRKSKHTVWMILGSYGVACGYVLARIFGVF